MNYNSPQSQQTLVLKTIAKRRTIYLILFAVFLILALVTSNVFSWWYVSVGVIILTGIFAGLSAVCNNTHRYIRSGGKKKGGGFLSVLICFLGMFIVPFITVFLCTKIRPLGELVLGVKFE